MAETKSAIQLELEQAETRVALARAAAAEVELLKLQAVAADISAQHLKEELRIKAEREAQEKIAAVWQAKRDKDAAEQAEAERLRKAEAARVELEYNRQSEIVAAQKQVSDRIRKGHRRGL